MMMSENSTAIVAALTAIVSLLAVVSIKAKARSKRQRHTIDSLTNILDSANEGIYVTDPDRRFLLWNKTAERITGFSPEAVIGRSCHDNVLRHTDLDGREMCMSNCPLHASMQTGSATGPKRIYLRHADGRRVPVEVRTSPLHDSEGAILGGVEIFQDITERLEQERLLGDRTNQLESVLNSISDGILFLDTAGAVTVFNRACSVLFELDSRMTGTPIHVLAKEAPLSNALGAIEQGYWQSVPEERSGSAVKGCPRRSEWFRCWTAANQAAARRNAPLSCCSCEVYRKVKTYLGKPRELTWKDKVFSVVSSFIEYRGTDELCEIIVFHDATADKLDAALKVAGAAAHELRQPLQVVFMLSDIFKLALAHDAQLMNYTNMLATSCRRMDQIIQSMSVTTRYKTKDYAGGERIYDFGAFEEQ